MIRFPLPEALVRAVGGAADAIEVVLDGKVLTAGIGVDYVIEYDYDDEEDEDVYVNGLALDMSPRYFKAGDGVQTVLVLRVGVVVDELVVHRVWRWVGKKYALEDPSDPTEPRFHFEHSWDEVWKGRYDRG